MHNADTLHKQKRYKEAQHSASEANALFVQLGRRMESALTFIHLSHALIEQQEFSEAGIHLQEGLQIAREINDPRCEILGLMAHGSLLGRQGDMPGSFAAFREASSLAQQLEDHKSMGQILNSAAEVIGNSGDYARMYMALIAAKREFAGLNLWDETEIEQRLIFIRSQLTEEQVTQIEYAAASYTPGAVLSFF